MVVERKVLLDALKLAMPGIESGSVMLQGSDSFVFHDGKLFTYNDSIAVLVPIESTGLIDQNVEGVVKAKEFFNVISKFSSDEISFEVKDSKSWVLKCGKAKVEMALLDLDYSKRLEGVAPNGDWEDLPDGFSDALASCRMVGNKSDLAGVYVRDNYVISTDGLQINMFTFKEKLPGFWISDNLLAELLKLSSIKRVEVGKSWVHFEAEDGVVFSVKMLNDEKFPYENIVNLMKNSKPSENDLRGTFPKELFPAVDRADNFAFDMLDRPVVRLTLSSEGIEVSAEKSSGKYVENISWESDAPQIEDSVVVYVNAVMMLSMSQHSLDFYLLKGKNKKGNVVPRLLFVSESSTHLMSTFSV